MRTSKTGLDLIRYFEGFRPNAYKALQSEQFYTIGYGHYGADVQPGHTISLNEATRLLKADLERFEAAVNKWMPNINQYQFDALVSFTYNCGELNLRKLTKEGNRSISEIAEALPKYNKAGGTVLSGLIKRRKAELAVFNGEPPKTFYVLRPVDVYKYEEGREVFVKRIQKGLYISPRYFEGMRECGRVKHIIFYLPHDPVCYKICEFDAGNEYLRRIY